MIQICPGLKDIDLVQLLYFINERIEVQEGSIFLKYMHPVSGKGRVRCMTNTGYLVQIE